MAAPSGPDTRRKSASPARRRSDGREGTSVVVTPRSCAPGARQCCSAASPADSAPALMCRVTHGAIANMAPATARATMPIQPK
jgi:hypothetical protein